VAARGHVGEPMFRLVVALTLALALGACPAEEEEEPEVQPGQEQEEPDEPEETPEEDREAEEALEPDEEADEEGRYVVEFESPYTYETDGLTLEIDGIAFTSRERLLEETPEAEEVIEETLQTFVALRMIAVNETGGDVDFFPDQGQIVLGDEQLDPDWLLSDSVGGGPMRDGVRSEGTIIWGSSRSFDEAIALEELRFIASAPFDDESFEPIGDDVDIKVEWEGR
jgi:hypothetical protein